MLRTVLGGTSPPDAAEANGKLLVISPTGGLSAGEGADGGEVESEGTPQASPAPSLPSGAASLITQIDGRVNPNQAPDLAAEASGGPAAEEGEVRNTWRNRVRNFFCCLAPSTHDQYVRQPEGAGNSMRAAPLPPPLWSEPVLGSMRPEDTGKKTLVLDLDETLVHSSFKPVAAPDYIIPVEIEGRVVDVYVLKRPYVDHFLRAVGERFEVVVFTASLGKYADPLLDLLDAGGVVRWRLFREACYPYEGAYVKDLQALGRPLESTIIVDNSPHSYVFQPENAVPIGTFIDDMADEELLDCLDLLLAVEPGPDVRRHIALEIGRRRAFGAGGSSGGVDPDSLPPPVGTGRALP